MLRHFEGLLFMVLSTYNDEKVASSEKKHTQFTTSVQAKTIPVYDQNGQNR